MASRLTKKNKPRVVYVKVVEGETRIITDPEEVAAILGSKGQATGGSAKQAAKSVAQVAKALEAADRQGLLHRDLEPETVPEPAERPFVEDFGLARVATPTEVFYAEEIARLAIQQHVVQTAMAAALTPILARRLSEMPTATYADKQELAKWVNSELRRFGLAILCPKTGRPSALIADSSSAEGRFQLLNETPEGKKVRSLSSKTLPVLNLVPSASIKEYVEFIDSSFHIDGSLTIDEAKTLVSEGPPETEPANLPLKVASLFEGLPEEFEERTAALTAVNTAFRQELANQLAPALNAKAQAMPHGTYEEKKALARWVNEELRRLDLAIKGPKTGDPSILAVDPGHHPEIGRFSIEHKTPDGKRHRSLTSSALPELELTEAPPRREALREWREKIEQERGGASRTEPESQDVEGHKAALASAHAANRQAVADELAPILNAQAREMPHGSYEEKKALARWVNAELRKFDLAIKCPKTGLPATLATGPGNHPEIGRFQLLTRGEDGKYHRPVSSPELFEFELMEAPPRHERLKNWQSRVSQQGGGASRA